MVAQAKQRYITPDEYLRRERKAKNKSEYENGTIVAMSGASAAHSIITYNLAVGLGPLLRAAGCQGYSSDMRLRIVPANCYYYPDLAVVCGEPQYETDMGLEHLLNPSIIFEIQSKTSEYRDRHVKFVAYHAIESLTTYVLISQLHAEVSVYTRERGAQDWNLKLIFGLDKMLPLSSIAAEIPLRLIYENAMLQE